MNISPQFESLDATNDNSLYLQSLVTPTINQLNSKISHGRYLKFHQYNTDA